VKHPTEETWTLSQQCESDNIVVLRFGPQPEDWMSMSVSKDRADLMRAAPELYRALERYVRGDTLSAASAAHFEIHEQAITALKKAKPR